MKRPSNKQELADVSLEIASDALHSLHMAIKTGECSVRDLNTIAANCAKIHRDAMADIAAEAKGKEDEERDPEKSSFNKAVESLLNEVGGIE
ncbi:hypothetical protein SCBWM1_gp102 [Synechococcus phage S-CBWM1]|uniref:Uncharacterized protein n=1 Tax=Synechococcus phage S-CBWM1 TaxID=2053653 RepID=A0A3G1L3N0_9CAUD|nr:hypothetical protein HOU61_gp095 [Synechococcus phage S-CBWM1]ATW62786.1 hypothetical protein SCBWM1_gp102 [Synechococcus phage S-CBWM1]